MSNSDSKVDIITCCNVCKTPLVEVEESHQYHFEVLGNPVTSNFVTRSRTCKKCRYEIRTFSSFQEAMREVVDKECRRFLYEVGASDPEIDRMRQLVGKIKQKSKYDDSSVNLWLEGK